MNDTETTHEADAEISSEWYFTANDGVVGSSSDRGDDFQPPHVIRHDDGLAEPHLRRLTICVLVLRNGFVVLGQSACALEEDFAPDIGRKLARAQAVKSVWPLIGFRKREMAQADIERNAVQINMED